jgi:hypothetical protein
MADQVGSGTVQGARSEPSGQDPHGSDVEPLEGMITPGKHVPFHGRPVSWVSVCTIIIGFIIGAIGLVVGPTWWLVWTGGAVVVLGGILALATGILNDWY